MCQVPEDAADAGRSEQSWRQLALGCGLECVADVVHCGEGEVEAVVAEVGFGVITDGLPGVVDGVGVVFGDTVESFGGCGELFGGDGVLFDSEGEGFEGRRADVAVGFERIVQAECGGEGCSDSQKGEGCAILPGFSGVECAEDVVEP